MGAPRRLVPATRCRRADDPSDVTARRMQNWLYAWQALRRRSARASRPGLEPLPAASPPRPTTCAATSRPSATTARSSSTRSPSSALALRGPTPLLERGARASSTATSPRTSGPTACTASARPTTTTIVLRSFARRAARTPAASAAALPAGYDERLRPCARLHFAAPTADPGAPTATGIPALLAPPTPATTATCCALAPAPGSPPASRSASFPVGGYFTSSAAAGGAARRDERFLIFDCGPLGDGGHGHYDLLSVEACGRRPAARRRPRPLHLRRGRAELAALVQGHRGPQHGAASTASTRRRTPARPPAAPSAEHRFLGRDTRHGLDVLRGEARSPATTRCTAARSPSTTPATG